MVAVAYRAGAQRREVGAGLGLAVAHAVHGLATQDLGQILPLLLRRAEHHQRVGLDRGTDPRRLAALHHLHEGDLLDRRARLAAELFAASPGRSSRSRRYRARKSASNSRLGMAWRRTPPCASPLQFCSSQSLHLLAQGVAGGTEIVLRQRRAAASSRYAASAPRAAARPPNATRVEMDALEMSRRLVLLGIADGAEGVLRFERHPPQRIAAEGHRAIDEISPVAVTAIVQTRRHDRASRARLRARSGCSPACAGSPGIFRSAGRTACAPWRSRRPFRTRAAPRHRHAPASASFAAEQPIVESADAPRSIRVSPARRQPNLIKTPGAHRPGRRRLHAGLIQRDDREARWSRSPRQDGCSFRRPRQNAATRSHAVDPEAEPSRHWLGIERAKRERDARRTVVQFLRAIRPPLPARQSDNVRLASAADHIGAGHEARPSSVITTSISRKPAFAAIVAKRRDALPDQSAPDRGDFLRRARRLCDRFRLPLRGRESPRRESRSIVLTSSPGSSVGAIGRTSPGRISACASP